MKTPNNKYEALEIKETISLCSPNGNLNREAIGWARKPLFIPNLKNHFLRKKLWNYWCVTGPEGMFSITISDVDYAGLAFVYYLDYSTGIFQEATEMIAFPLGKSLPQSISDNASFETPNVKVDFQNFEGGTEVRLNVLWKNFHGKKLNAEFIISYPPNHDTLNVVVPWSDSKFQYTSKQNCLPARGFVQIEPIDDSSKQNNNTQTIGEIKPFRLEFKTEDSFACADYGRGVWPYSISWNWGSFSTRAGSDTIGLNMGGQWTDGTGISENGYVINGNLTKITEPLQWIYDKKNYKNKWIMKTLESDSIELEFEPFYVRRALSNFIVIFSEVFQCFGRYNGVIRTKTQNYKIENVIGWAEDHKARW
ncbi:DUF2804 domain-containing protein [Leptospira sp. GIMC2001]|uniref:DUF2804 domain-containing protein n=1 Tax=Leptospira sp. GIMC2001 TaxID=1513297 RepID=UPI00234B85FA|nr:DUF2804 domain-containing protein [Leptospira sp. GIMC2001]WCL50362.1 DUF2804 domain-containing protein [Leptospira sp. GIMC2001]